jgi:hypothetical protein
MSNVSKFQRRQIDLFRLGLAAEILATLSFVFAVTNFWLILRIPALQFLNVDGVDRNTRLLSMAFATWGAWAINLESLSPQNRSLVRASRLVLTFALMLMLCVRVIWELGMIPRSPVVVMRTAAIVKDVASIVGWTAIMAVCGRVAVRPRFIWRKRMFAVCLSCASTVWAMMCLVGWIWVFSSPEYQAKLMWPLEMSAYAFGGVACATCVLLGISVGPRPFSACPSDQPNQ